MNSGFVFNTMHSKSDNLNANITEMQFYSKLGFLVNGFQLDHSVFIALVILFSPVQHTHHYKQEHNDKYAATEKQSNQMDN